MADIALKDEAIKYIAIEMINKDDTDAAEVVAGLFKGRKVRNNESTKQDEVFILIHEQDGSTYMLNTDFHNIISIEVLYETMRVMTYFMMGDEDQKSAREIISDLMKRAVEKEVVLVNDPTVIDIQKYKEVPESVMKGETAATKSGVAKPAGKSSNYTPAKSNVNNNYTYVKKEPSPQLWKRRSKKPTTETLLELTKSLDLLEKGKLKVNVPVLPGEMGKKESTTGVTSGYDDEYTYGSMC